MSINWDKVNSILNISIGVTASNDDFLKLKSWNTKALVNELLKLGQNEKIPYNIFSKISGGDCDIAFHELAIYNRLYFTLSYKVEYIFEVETPDNYRYKNGIKLDYDKYDIFIYDAECGLSGYSFIVIDRNNHIIKLAGGVDYYNNNVDCVFTDEEFPAVKKMIEVNKLLLEMRTN